ncbi:ABC transporter permease [Caulobacter sp. S45]|uniref:ABC transporter permease n=1 Tax=Caulobacter sp. S45 TaxID=1641861 RepID=UPI0015764DE2|nr:ABC transporter permease [Caulobacter sp. S45]
MDAVEGAFRDIIDGVRLAPLWSRLAWEQTVARFRRTIFGPFWLTANLLAISFSLSVVFGGLMGQNYRTNFALIISGILSWSIIGPVMSEAASVFISAGGLMQTMKLPLTFHVLLMMTRNVINFLAQLIALWIVLAVLRLGAVPTWHLLIGLPIVLIDMSLVSMILAIPSTRFRDVNQTVGFAVQILFFITPVFWVPSQMHGKKRLLFDLNPFGHLLELVRQPLIGREPTLMHFEWGLGMMVILSAVVITQLALYRKRVVFWL